MTQTVHTYPTGDCIDHVTDGRDCSCMPAVEAVPDGEGGYGWLITHNIVSGVDAMRGFYKE